MNTVMEITVLFLLAVLIFQDFKSRSVYWYIFPMIFIAGLVLNYIEYRSFFFRQLILSQLFLVIQLILVTIYFSVKNKKLVNITDSQIGLGDILFLLSITPMLTTLNYIFYYISSLFFALLFYGIYALLIRTEKTIPLAGIQAIFLSGLLILLKVSGNISLLKSDILLSGLVNKFSASL